MTKILSHMEALEDLPQKHDELHLEHEQTKHDVENLTNGLSKHDIRL